MQLFPGKRGIIEQVVNCITIVGTSHTLIYRECCPWSCAVHNLLNHTCCPWVCPIFLLASWCAIQKGK